MNKSILYKLILKTLNNRIKDYNVIFNKLIIFKLLILYYILIQYTFKYLKVFN